MHAESNAFALKICSYPYKNQSLPKNEFTLAKTSHVTEREWRQIPKTTLDGVAELLRALLICQFSVQDDLRLFLF